MYHIETLKKYFFCFEDICFERGVINWMVKWIYFRCVGPRAYKSVADTYEEGFSLAL
jgi:hypothetical protein